MSEMLIMSDGARGKWIIGFAGRNRHRIAVRPLRSSAREFVGGGQRLYLLPAHRCQKRRQAVIVRLPRCGDGVECTRDYCPLGT